MNMHKQCNTVSASMGAIAKGCKLHVNAGMDNHEALVIQVDTVQPCSSRHC